MIELIIAIGVGIVFGMYITSQIKCSIRSRINNKELINNLNEEKKTKQ